MIAIQLPKTTHFICSSCWNGCCSSLSRNSCSLKRIALLEMNVWCRHSRRRLFSAQRRVLGYRKKDTGRQRAGSRGSGMPRRVQQVGNTWLFSSDPEVVRARLGGWILDEVSCKRA